MGQFINLGAVLITSYDPFASSSSDLTKLICQLQRCRDTVTAAAALLTVQVKECVYRGRKTNGQVCDEVYTALLRLNSSGVMITEARGRPRDHHRVTVLFLPACVARKLRVRGARVHLSSRSRLSPSKAASRSQPTCRRSRRFPGPSLPASAGGSAWWGRPITRGRIARAYLHRGTHGACGVHGRMLARSAASPPPPERVHRAPPAYRCVCTPGRADSRLPQRRSASPRSVIERPDASYDAAWMKRRKDAAGIAVPR